jgi:hypothetical protein
MRELRELRGEDDMSISRPVGEERTQSRSDLEARVSALEHQVMTLTAAVDAASRLRISTPLRINHDIRIAGGKAVRRILDKGGLIRG